MNSKDFTYLLQDPQAITHEQTETVKSVIDQFPYFQSARAIYLKGLKDQSSFKYNQELKVTAAYTSDRSILFDYITSDTFLQNEISQIIQNNIKPLKDIKVTAEDISVSKSTTFDDTLKQQIHATEGVLDPALFEPKKASTPDTTAPQNTEQTPAGQLLNLGKPLRFDKKETHSFNEWLKITHFKPIQREEDNLGKEVNPNETEKAKKFELIDRFITRNPKINPSKTATSKGNLAKAQMIQPEALMTETLARVYVEQKNYKKAIQSYKILILKYPEKSSFFANQIKAIEQLQEQNN
ncbi:hypothetical protein FEZ18_09140 [Oceanihabitans sp. IOP_32]|uniref:hypothetical protein n=1 Tax=Oceanihabitans sp. IOP_32 TaxID=2529032 RepID=UPI001293640C|nr:hypothetical protein [Oceanihabitans sp. IOP_32]QFZ54951.1 hypothetical protein FEZ18_09140 [Oceanihabitans sp. IOP_32]